MTTEALTTLHHWLFQHNAIDAHTTPQSLLDLTRLDLSSRNLLSLPDSIALLPKLSALNLANNRLESLPDLSTLNALVHLDLRRNQLKSLCESFGNLSVRSLNLSANRLKSIDTLRSCNFLRVLDLSANTIDETTGIFDAMPDLRSLNLAHNALGRFSIAPHQSLEHLNLSNNFLTAVDPALGRLEELKTLDCSNNQLTDVTLLEGFASLERLDLSSNRIVTARLGACEMLEELSLDDNPLNVLRFEPDFAPDLRLFSAQGCGLSRLDLPPSRTLESLLLADNQLSALPSTLSSYTALKELDLSANALTDLSEALKPLHGLHTLMIDRNPLPQEQIDQLLLRGIDNCDLSVKHAIRIDAAKPEDCPVMARLLGQLFSIERDFVIDYERQLAGLELLLQDPRCRVFVAKHQERVVGMITMQPLISTASGGAVGQVEDLIVDATYRNIGIGSKLLARVVEEAKTLAYRRIALGADMSNRKALEFYRSHGFVKTNLNSYHLSL
ncbi:MAG: GNAT family N-acetyltransferase [Campylobacterales bacterium]|nr:GNAT family N-acetyltransferase [Campylobacterales bacterium]